MGIPLEPGTIRGTDHTHHGAPEKIEPHSTDVHDAFHFGGTRYDMHQIANVILMTLSSRGILFECERERIKAKGAEFISHYLHL